jgi:ribosomal protein L11 methylase PrmA
MQLKQTEDFYYSPDGNMVFTEAYHLKRGYCCGSGCRHCPYQHSSIKLSPQVLVYANGPRPSAINEDWVVLPQMLSTAFGDGTHPTTRLCAGAVDFLCRQKHLSSVLDVGTGTGILARIARARGAEFIVGTDIDPAALESAKENSALDSHTVEIEITNAMPDHWGPRFDLVVANILEGPLTELAPSLAAALAPKGHLLISGFTRLQVHSLKQAFTNQGLCFMSESSLGEWAMLMFNQ